MVGQAIGPVLGGLLNSAWGFRSIFWFLFCFGATVLLLVVALLPETQHGIAGNGTIPLKGLHKPLVYWIRPPKTWTEHGATTSTTTAREKHGAAPPKKLRAIVAQRMIAPLKHVLEKDVAVLLLWGAMIYTAWSMVTSSTATVLLHEFPYLTQWQVGLCFLPNGFGCVLGSISTGYLLDKTFRSVESQYKTERGLDTIDHDVCTDFPFERARLLLMPYYSLAFIVALALYGPSYEFNDLRRYFAANLAASLGLQFFIAFTATAIFNINSTLLVDCFPNGSAGATATNNLFRCLVGAAGVSAIEPLIDAVRIRNAFLILTGIICLFSPLVVVQWKYGQKWRNDRQNRTSRK